MYCLGPLGRLEEALATEDLALSKDPLEPGLIVVRSLVLESLGRQDAEAQSVERLAQLDPHFAFGQFLLVRLRARQRRFDEAIALASAPPPADAGASRSGPSASRTARPATRRSPMT